MKLPIRAALSCLSVFVLIQPLVAADKWISIRSKNFMLVGSASEAEIRRVGRTLEEFRSAMAMMFPKMDQPSSVQTTVLVFKNDESFAPFKPQQNGKPANALAFFQPGEDVNYIALTGAMASPNIVLHEYVHFLTRENLTGLPLWASEGLAECYSTFEVNGRGNEFTLGRVPERHLVTLSETGFMPFKKLFEVQQGSPEYNEASKQGIFYAESWALVHYLMFGAEGKRRSQFVQFLTALSKGDPFDDSFADAFQTDYGTLEDEVRNYLRKRSTWPTLKMTAKENLLIDVRSMNVATLTEAESEYYLGDLLLHMNRLGEAETHLIAASSKAPTLTAAQASLGVLRVRQKKYDEALAILKKAVESDSKNHMVNFYYGYTLERVDSDTAGAAGAVSDRYEAMRTYAKKAIELGPRFVEGYALLARANLSLGEHLDEAEATMKKALAIAPGRDDLHLLLAQTYLRGNRIQDARGVLMNLERVTSDPDTRRRTTSLLDQTEQAFTFTEIKPEAAVEPLSPPATPAAPAPPLPPAPTIRTDTVLEALTPIGPAVEGEKVSGLLINLDCTKGLTLRVRTDSNTLDFHSPQPDKIQFLSYTADVTDNIKCGPRNPGTPVSITFQPVQGAPGTPLVVEFLEKK
jgi:tetratricopeptide (TPR) repeat protein